MPLLVSVSESHDVACSMVTPLPRGHSHVKQFGRAVNCLSSHSPQDIRLRHAHHTLFGVRPCAPAAWNNDFLAFCHGRAVMQQLDQGRRWRLSVESLHATGIKHPTATAYAYTASCILAWRTADNSVALVTWPPCQSPLAMETNRSGCTTASQTGTISGS
jgi:hypothetical protein